jgi:uncharacterized protein with HEPN domain
VPFRDNPTHLRDILESIGHIEDFLSGMDFKSYTMDLKTRSAVERQMQMITEAAKRLGEDAEALCPGPDWKGLCRMGDILRHGYHKVDDETVWNTVKDELPPLREAAMKALVANGGLRKPFETP